MDYRDRLAEQARAVEKARDNALQETAKLHALAREARKNGLTANQIARVVDVSATAVHAWIREFSNAD